MIIISVGFEPIPGKDLTSCNDGYVKKGKTDLEECSKLCGANEYRTEDRLAVFSYEIHSKETLKSCYCYPSEFIKDGICNSTYSNKDYRLYRVPGKYHQALSTPHSALSTVRQIMCPLFFSICSANLLSNSSVKTLTLEPPREGSN